MLPLRLLEKLLLREGLEKLLLRDELEKLLPREEDVMLEPRDVLTWLLVRLCGCCSERFRCCIHVSFLNFLHFWSSSCGLSLSC